MLVKTKRRTRAGGANGAATNFSLIWSSRACAHGHTRYLTRKYECSR